VEINSVNFDIMKNLALIIALVLFCIALVDRMGSSCQVKSSTVEIFLVVFCHGLFFFPLALEPCIQVPQYLCDAEKLPMEDFMKSIGSSKKALCFRGYVNFPMEILPSAVDRWTSISALLSSFLSASALSSFI